MPQPIKPYDEDRRLRSMKTTCDNLTDIEAFQNVDSVAVPLLQSEGNNLLPFEHVGGAIRSCALT